MEILATIRDTDVQSEIPDPKIYKDRVAARAVVLDEHGQVALFHATIKKYHKLPGGGVEVGEDLKTALSRELLEEIGCQAEVIAEIGSIEEYRNKYSLHQISYCFLAKLAGPKGESHMEQGEIDEGFIAEWADLDKAIVTLENEKNVEDYQGKFIQQRDLTFLKEAKKLINK